MQGVSINLPDNILNHPEFLTEEEEAKLFHQRKLLLKLIFAVPPLVERELCNSMAVVESDIIFFRTAEDEVRK